MQHTWHIGWFWFWTLVAVLPGMLLPLVVGGKHRLTYAACLSMLGLFVLSIEGWRGIHRHDQAAIGTGDLSSSKIERPSYLVGFSSSAGCINVTFQYTRDQFPEFLQDPPAGPYIFWDPAPGARYPEPGGPTLFNKWGFQMIWWSDSPKPGSVWIARRAAIIIPIPVPMALLLIAPALYLRRRFLIPRHRRKHNLCLKCAYPRQGLPPDRPCPECGTNPPVPKTANPTPPAPSIPTTPSP